MNRKSALTLICFFLVLSSIKSQDTLKVTAGRWSTELNLNPFDGSLTLNNTNTQIKARKFITDRTAFRIAITTNYLQNNNNRKSEYGSYPIDESIRRNSFQTVINLGIEKHLKGTRRISPYWGWEVGLGFKGSKEVNRNGSTQKTIKGAWEVVSQTYYTNNGYYYTYTTMTERGYWSIGGNLIAGFDFYMAKDFYFGFEILFGLDYYNYSNIDITTNTPSNTVYPKYDDETWRMGPKLVNGIRIGYIF